MQTHTCPERLTEISRVVVSWTVKAQVLQVRDEIRDRPLVDALTLTEDVELGEEEHRNRVNTFFQHTAFPESPDQ